MESKFNSHETLDVQNETSGEFEPEKFETRINAKGQTTRVYHKFGIEVTELNLSDVEIQASRHEYYNQRKSKKA